MFGKREPVMLLLLLAFVAVYADDFPPECDDLRWCECLASEHPAWIVVNCTLEPQDQISFWESTLPNTTMMLTIFGGKSVEFTVNSLSHLTGLQAIEFRGTQTVIMKTRTSVWQNSSNIQIQSNDCHLFQMETETFVKVKGPVSVSVINCTFVTFGRSAFSLLQTLNVRFAKKLQLIPGTFTLDQPAVNIGDHGPGMMIDLSNLELENIPPQGFTASAAMVRMEDVLVDTVSSNAFGANTYNIVLAINTRFNTIQPSAFAPNTLIHRLQFFNCTLHNFANNAIQSAIGHLHMTSSRFDRIGTGAINATVATVTLKDNFFKLFDDKGFILSSSSRYYIQRNFFEYLPPQAITAPGSTIIELIFVGNQVAIIVEESVPIIGKAFRTPGSKVAYDNNYYNLPCSCNITKFLTKAMMSDYERAIETGSLCVVDRTLSACFNVPRRQIEVSQFLTRVCTEEDKDIECDASRSKIKGNDKDTEIKKSDDNNGVVLISDKNLKILGIISGTIIICVVVISIYTLIRSIRHGRGCAALKVLLPVFSCDWATITACPTNIDHARSLSQLSVNEFSERLHLNEPRIHEMVNTALPNIYTEEIIRMVEKATQTMPGELTKELLENLKKRLNDPINYDEAREMIEHLYELIKVEEDSDKNETKIQIEENIYELPYQDSMPHIGRNMTQMVSIGTRAPSIDKLLPLSPYNRQTALVDEYILPKDFAVHLYAEIANTTRSRLDAIPDVLATKPVPRGPYLRAVRDKMYSNPAAGPSNIAVITKPENMSIKSNTSAKSRNSAKMLNRPLPEKPNEVQDPGEGTSRG